MFADATKIYLCLKSIPIFLVQKNKHTFIKRSKYMWSLFAPEIPLRDTDKWGLMVVEQTQINCYQDDRETKATL
jgi:hypothetical protein